MHLSASADWGTPLEVIEVVEYVLGDIDLDPATSEYWNDHGAKAPLWLDGSEGLNGLTDPWSDPGADPVRALLNPPGDTSGQLVKRFWSRLVRERDAGVVDSAVWIGFSLEQLVSCQHESRIPINLPMIVPNRRLCYRRTPLETQRALRASAAKAELKGALGVAARLLKKAESIDLNGPPLPAEQPTHGSFLTLLPSKDYTRCMTQISRWEEAAQELGWACRV